MITVNDRFSIDRDTRCWHLHDVYMGTDKDGEPKLQKRISYYANLTQISHAILDRSAGKCQSLTEILRLLKNAESVVTRRLMEVAEQ